MTPSRKKKRDTQRGDFHISTLSHSLENLDPRNTSSARPEKVMELALCFDIDPAVLWNEYRAYTLLVEKLDPPTIQQAVYVMWNPRDRELRVFPLISQLLARLAVLPASSASVERVFSTMKKIKTPLHNRLKTSILDCLIFVSMSGPEPEEFDPIPSAEKRQSLGNRQIKNLSTVVTSD